MFCRRPSRGHLIASLNYGVIVGLAPLWEHEGMDIVAEGLDKIWEGTATRSDLLFYDNSRKLRWHRLRNPNPSWPHPRYVVDR